MCGVYLVVFVLLQFYHLPALCLHTSDCVKLPDWANYSIVGIQYIICITLCMYIMPACTVYVYVRSAAALSDAIYCTYCMYVCATYCTYVASHTLTLWEQHFV